MADVRRTFLGKLATCCSLYYLNKVFNSSRSSSSSGSSSRGGGRGGGGGDGSNSRKMYSPTIQLSLIHI